ncbi:MAG: DUF262 domain-containing protein [Prevotellaceae bacterium]|nr:DUF262 domain-containing protein [Prevotellaceae bacterium]
MSAHIEEKSIRQLIDTTTFIVPEIQREYVWGNENNKALLNRFLDDLTEYAKTNKTKNIGFLYSYIPAYDENKVDAYLIDGQQRFTTLFLLLFYLALKEGKKNEFVRLFEIEPDTEKTKFDYRVRNLTHDFIITLVKNIDSIETLQNIESATWFLSVFKNDVSINAIIESFKTFNSKLINNNVITFDYLAENVKFWYFQTETTSQGEELYITMNSRGESIKDFENIKAALFEQEPHRKMEFGKKYAIWEDFFWRLPDAINTIDKQKEKLQFDNYMDSFFELILQCETGKEKSIEKFDVGDWKLIKFSILEQYMSALFNIERFIHNTKEKFGLKDIVTGFFNKPSETQNKIPLIALLLFYKELNIKENILQQEDYTIILSEDEEREIARVYHFFYNSVRRGRKEQNAVVKLMKKQCISLVEYQKSKQIQIYKLIDTKYDTTNENKQVNNILSKHETDKLRITKESAALRTEIEDIFWKVQNETAYILEGSLQLLFETMEWQNNCVWDNAILDSFNEYVKIFSTLWAEENIKKALCDDSDINNSLLTRGLLTIDDYSIGVGRNRSFGYKEKWNKIIQSKECRDVFSVFLRKLYKKSDYLSAIKSIIADFVQCNESNKKTWRHYFVKYPRMTQPINSGYNLFRWWSKFNIRLLNKEALNGYNVNPYILALHEKDEKQECFSNNGYTTGDKESCLKINNELTILVADELNTWIIRVPKDKKVDLGTLSKKHSNDSGDVNYFFNYDDSDDFIEKGIDLVKEVAKLKVEDLCLP